MGGGVCWRVVFYLFVLNGIRSGDLFVQNVMLTLQSEPEHDVMKHARLSQLFLKALPTHMRIN